MNNIELVKKRKILENAINHFQLHLSGLSVFAELGSNDYLFTPIIAAIAGAEKVFAIVTDSKYGKKASLKATIEEICHLWHVPRVIEVVDRKTPKNIGDADIVLNSGFVRPIDKITIDMMKSTAVVPLMWETWELRSDELDLYYARKKGILVLGTNEEFLYNNNGFLVTKLLFEQGLGVYKDNILIISSGRIGRSISKFFLSTKVSHSRVVFDKEYDIEEKKYIVSIEEIKKLLPKFDAIVIAEHHHNVDIISNTGLLKPIDIYNANPVIKIVHICGHVNERDLNKYKLKPYPTPIAPFGYMTIGPAYLDSHAALELNTAGLKVGEIMARNRLKYDLKSAYEESIKRPLVDDFDKGYLNLDIE